MSPKNVEMIDCDNFSTSASHVNSETIHAIKVTDAWCKWDRESQPPKRLRVLAAQLTGAIEKESELTSEVSRQITELLRNIQKY